MKKARSRIQYLFQNLDRSTTKIQLNRKGAPPLRVGISMNPRWMHISSKPYGAANAVAWPIEDSEKVIEAIRKAAGFMEEYDQSETKGTQ